MPFLIVLGSGAFVLGLAYVIWISVTKQGAQGTPNWPEVTGTIARARVYTLEYETPQGVKRSYTPLVRYEYTVEGRAYTAVERNVLPYYHKTHDELSAAEAVVAQYPIGSEVSVYYNPASPGQSLLEVPKPAAHNAVLYFGLTNVLMGIAIVALGIVLLD